MYPFETIYTDTRKIACDGTGSGDSSGHPRVYLTIEPPKHSIDCPYCSRRFILKKEA